MAEKPPVSPRDACGLPRAGGVTRIVVRHLVHAKCGREAADSRQQVGALHDQDDGLFGVPLEPAEQRAQREPTVGATDRRPPATRDHPGHLQRQQPGRARRLAHAPPQVARRSAGARSGVGMDVEHRRLAGIPLVERPRPALLPGRVAMADEDHGLPASATRTSAAINSLRRSGPRSRAN